MTNIIKDRDSFTKEIVYKANNWSEKDLAFFNQIKFPKETPESLSKSTAYYLQKFYLYEQGKKYLGWNWAAFLWGGYWGNYRRLYILFFIEIIIGLIGILIDDRVSPYNLTILNIIISVISLGYRIMFGCYANMIYTKKIIKQIKKGSPAYKPNLWLAMIPLGIVFLISILNIILDSHSS